MRFITPLFAALFCLLGPAISVSANTELGLDSTLPLQDCQDSQCSNIRKILRNKRSLRRTVREIGLANKLPHIEKSLIKGCEANGHTVGELDRDISKMKTCLEAKQIFITPKTEYLENLEKCTKETRKIVTDCLPQKLKYLPELLYEIAKSMINFLYEDFLLIADVLGPCTAKLKSEENLEKYHSCVEKANSDDGIDIPESKAQFCRRFVASSKCFVKQMDEHCHQSKDLNKLRENYVKANEQPCKG